MPNPINPAAQSARLAHIIYDAIHDHDLLDLDPVTACHGLQSLSAALLSAGAPLERFAVVEIMEGAGGTDGTIDAALAYACLARTVEDLAAIRDAVGAYADAHPRGV